MVQAYISTIENMEVRVVDKVEGVIKSKDKKKPDIEYRYLEVGFDDVNGHRLVFKDKDMSRENFYKRGMIGTLALQTTVEYVSKQDTSYVSEKERTVIHDFFPDTEAK